MNRRDSKRRREVCGEQNAFVSVLFIRPFYLQQENTNTDARGLLNVWRKTKGSRMATSLRPAENVHPKASAYGAQKTKNCPDFLKPKETRK